MSVHFNWSRARLVAPPDEEVTVYLDEDGIVIRQRHWLQQNEHDSLVLIPKEHALAVAKAVLAALRQLVDVDSLRLPVAAQPTVTP